MSLHLDDIMHLLTQNPSPAFVAMTLHQRMYFVSAYYKAKKNLQGAIVILRQGYPDMPLPTNRELLLLVSQFEATGTIEFPPDPEPDPNPNKHAR